LFSQTAVDELGEILTASGSLFPVSIAGRAERFYWYWCTTVVDCIDEPRTKRGPPSQLPLERRLILEPAFHLDRIGNEAIFVVPGQSRQFDLFVTDGFKARIRKGKLSGFSLARGRFDSRPWIS
jgi:hypothetical protein